MRNFKEQLNQELDAFVPPMSGKIKRQPIVTQAPDSGKRKESRSHRWKFGFLKYLVACSVAAAIMIGVILGVQFMPAAAPQAYGIVTLEINPAVTFLIDEENKVMKISALNTDADILLADETFYASLTEIPVERAAKLFTEKAEKAGYLTDGKTVNLSVVAEGEKASNDLLSACKSALNAYIENASVNAALNAVIADVGALSKKLDVSANGFSDLVKRANELPTYSFEREIKDLDKTDLSEKYRENVSHGIYKELMEKLLTEAYERATLVNKIVKANDDIKGHGKKPGQEGGFGGVSSEDDFWEIKNNHPDDKEWDADFKGKMDEMQGLLDEYDNKFGKKPESYEQLQMEQIAYERISSNLERVQDLLGSFSVVFDFVADEILLMLPDDFAGVAEELKIFQNAGMPATKEDYIAQTKELYRLYAQYISEGVGARG